MSPRLDVAVVGAGVAGLTTAHELRRAGLTVRVYEEQPHVGGRMHSFRYDGYTIDTGAEQISPHGYRATWQLLHRLGVRRADVPRIGAPLATWRDGRAHPGVADRRAVLTGAGLSPRARVDLARMLAWSARRRAGFDDDHPERSPLGTATVAEFAARYHRDVHDYLLQPLCGSFFGWDTARSTAAPLIGLLLAVGPAADWRTYRDGMDLLARRLASGLDVVTGRAVHQVTTGRGGARLHLDDGSVTARAAVLAVPAPVAARLYATPVTEEAAYLSACTFTPALKVSCLLDRPLAPAGDRRPYVLLTPRAEDQVLSCVIADHVKHPSRAPAGKGLLTLMADAATIPDLLRSPHAEVVDRLTTAALRYVPGLRTAGREYFVHAYTHGLPEATPKALRLRSRFMARGTGPVEYAGDWVMLRPSSEGAVRSGALAASRVLARLAGSPGRPARPIEELTL
ncbi:NAD(P)/FAD-dependent oxidoreductase [Streptomyces sp. NPDC059786]|uniref:NAD(P)/FAD-dependent oxidoreductase n=1 Tax=Streptomyces sp. NPDC059786 TaxID=3346946 RepID=UPI00364AB787